MKNLKLMLILATMTLAAVSCGPRPEIASECLDEEATNAIVLYYSQTGNTAYVAQEIADQMGADIEKIVPVHPYDTGFIATIELCLKEREEGMVTEIEPLTADLSNYSVIFIGYPVWFGTYAPPIATFLDQTDLRGKLIVPFCTFGSGGLESSVRDMTEKLPSDDVMVLSGYGVRAARLDAVPYEVDQFLKANGFLEGEYVELEDFPEQHEVSEEEAAIFNAAVDGYPMLHAQAKTVASRVLPDGTEYLFTAVDLPREGRDDMPPAGELQVYVTVVEGEAPVFTHVER